MVIDLNLDNINLLNGSFLLEADVKKELSTNPFAKYLVYLDSNKVIGYIYYSDIYERCEINQIEVMLDKRNCGIGTMLIKELISSVNKGITLEVRIDNYPAIKLYEKFGFEKKAIRKGYYNGVDGILMEKI